MANFDDRQPSVSLPAAAWRPAGAVYLAFCLAGLAAGLWPEAVFLSRDPAAGAPLPTLKTLAASQIAFGLLVWPLVVLARAQRGPRRRYWGGAVAEMIIYLVLAGPFYVAAAYLADAVATDVVRSAIYVACVWTLAVAAGAQLGSGKPGRVVVVLVLAALGLPAAHYVALEFITPESARLLGRLSPATFAWSASASRGPSWYPQPLWAAIVWPAAAAAGVFLFMLLPGRGRRAQAG